MEKENKKISALTDEALEDISGGVESWKSDGKRPSEAVAFLEKSASEAISQTLPPPRFQEDS